MKLACVGLVAMSVAAIACGGKVSDVSDGGTSTDHESAGNHGSNGDQDGANTSAPPTSTASSPPPPSFTAAQVKAALAHCGDPHGPLVSVATWGDVRTHMTGAWAVCSDSTSAPNLLSTGVVFASDGTFQSLISDGGDGLVAGYGVVNQGNYFFYTGQNNDVHSDGDAVSGAPYVTISAASGDQSPAGQFVGNISFETSPRRMYATEYYEPLGQFDVWLIALE